MNIDTCASIDGAETMAQTSKGTSEPIITSFLKCESPGFYQNQSLKYVSMSIVSNHAGGER